MEKIILVRLLDFENMVNLDAKVFSFGRYNSDLP